MLYPCRLHPCRGNCVSVVFLKSYFLFYVKKRVTFYLFFRIFFLDFLKKQTRAYIKILRHSSLDSNVFNMYVRFEVCNLYNEKVIDVQKIKVKRLIFEYFL